MTSEARTALVDHLRHVHDIDDRFELDDIGELLDDLFIETRDEERDRVRADLGDVDFQDVVETDWTDAELEVAQAVFEFVKREVERSLDPD